MRHLPRQLSRLSTVVVVVAAAAAAVVGKSCSGSDPSLARSASSTEEGMSSPARFRSRLRRKLSFAPPWLVLLVLALVLLVLLLLLPKVAHASSLWMTLLYFTAGPVNCCPRLCAGGTKATPNLRKDSTTVEKVPRVKDCGMAVSRRVRLCLLNVDLYK